MCSLNPGNDIGVAVVEVCLSYPNIKLSMLLYDEKR